LQDRSLTLATEALGVPADLSPHFAAEDPSQQAWDAQSRAFQRLLEQGGEPVATAAQGRAVQAAIDAIYRSASEQCEVPVS
jgi:predicted dehydrogenase